MSTSINLFPFLVLYDNLWASPDQGGGGTEVPNSTLQDIAQAIEELKDSLSGLTTDITNIRNAVLPGGDNDIASQVQQIYGIVNQQVSSIYQWAESTYSSLNHQDCPFTSENLGILAAEEIYGDLGAQVESDLQDALDNGLPDTFDTPLENAILLVLQGFNVTTGFPIGLSFSTKTMDAEDLEAMAPIIARILLGDFDLDPVYSPNGPIYLFPLALNVKGILVNQFLFSFPEIGI